MKRAAWALVLVFSAIAATPNATTTSTTTPAKKAAKKPVAPAKKAVAKKKTVRRRVAPPVAVSPAVRQSAFQAVSARTSVPADSIEGASALVPFFEQISHPASNGPVRILQFGDSHTASDDWADEMRQDFQRRFGAGGAGFTLPGRPFLGYRRFDSRGSNSAGWYTDGIVTRKGDGIYGLGGISLTAHAPGQTVGLSVECQQLELHYLRQPGGGQMNFSVDGVAVSTIDTDGDFGPGVYRFTPEVGAHQFALRTLSASPVRLFGWVAENRNGVTYETLGINGAQADLQLDWNTTVLDGEIAGRDPGLVVVAYGTNEALSKSWTAEQYRESLIEVIRRLRAAAPLASILLVGPPDCEYRLRDGGRRTFPHLDEVIELQRQVALDSGCAFWDWRARMGGPGSVHQWVQAGLGQADHTHLTSAGYRMVGDMLFSEIMNQYDRFQAAMANRTDGQ